MTMTRESIFEAWAPAGGWWSPWVKPVLFATMLPPYFEGTVASVDVSWAPRTGATALVVDLPVPEGVFVAVSLASRGYRPVPLYNAHPGTGDPLTAVVDVRPIADALVMATPPLLAAEIPPDAAPAFLLDADRRLGRAPPRPGMFDNRSVSFVTDFPSANLLLSRGITRGLLVQRGAMKPQADVAHTLRLWQAAGMTIEAVSLGDGVEGPVPCPLKRPSRLAIWWHTLTAAAGFRRNPLGGFGGMVPEPSSSGG